MQQQITSVHPQDRRSYLGGSDIASIMGLSPWKTAYELWEEKTAAEFVVPEVEPNREKLYRRGKKLEPFVMELIEEERDIFILKRNQRYLDDDYPFMACEVDFEFLADDGMCNGEVKTVSPFAASEWGEEGTDEIPLYYCLQAMWGLGINKDRPRTLVAGMVGMDDLRLYDVVRDDELIAEIRARAIHFWNENVVKKVPPPPQNVSDVNKLIQKFGGFTCLGDKEVWKNLKRLKGIKAAQKRLDEAKDKHEMAIKEYLLLQAEANGITESPKKFEILGPDGKKACTLALQHRKAYSVSESSFLVLRTA